MSFALTTEGLKGWFTLVDKDGYLRTGAVSGGFIVTAVKPDDSANTTVSVSESTQKPGVYTFLIPNTFLTVVGVYVIVLEVDITTNPKVTDVTHQVWRVSENDFDTIGNNTVLIPALL